MGPSDRAFSGSGSWGQLGNFPSCLLDRVFKDADALHEDVAAAMQPPLATVEAEATLDAIVTALTGRTNAVLVARGGRPVGVVTRSDLLEYLAHRRQ